MAVSVKQIQQLDETAINRCGVPSLALMENAGRSVAQETLKLLRNKRNPEVCVICGLGNNAGDGFVVARHLINAGLSVRVLLIGRGRRLKHDAAINYEILKKIKYPVLESDRVSKRQLKIIQSADIIVDAIFGVGLNRRITEPFLGFIEAVNRLGKKVISVDIPSGLDGTTGRIYGACVIADVTVTFTLMKKGFLKMQGPVHAGKVVVADIGIPLALIKKMK